MTDLAIIPSAAPALPATNDAEEREMDAHIVGLWVEPKLRPCVVVAGGREPAHVFAYPGHAIVHRAGMLPCNADGSCWKSDVVLTVHLGAAAAKGKSQSCCLDPVEGKGGHAHAKCQTLITPAEVARAIWNYYDSGVLAL